MSGLNPARPCAFVFGPEAVFMHQASLLEKRVVGD
jgi:hypothetical protein